MLTGLIMEIFGDLESEEFLLGKNEIYDYGISLSSYLEREMSSSYKKNYLFNIAAIHQDTSLSYNILNSRANLMARNLSKFLQTLKYESVIQNSVGLLINEGFDRLIAILSCLKLGLSVVPLNSERSNEQFQEIITKTNIEFIIYDQFNETYIKDFDLKVSVIFVESLLSELDQIENINLLESEILIPYQIENTVVILCTSGSSGSTKVINLTHKQILNRIIWQWKHLPYKKDERVCHRTGFMFVDNIIECLSCLLAGITMIIISPVEACDVNYLSEVIYKHKVTWLLSIPSLLQRWLQEVENNCKIKDLLKSLNTLICSGEMLLPNLALRFMNIFQENKCRLVNLYGSTEVTGDVTCEIFTDLVDIQKYTRNGFLSVGSPISNNKVILKPTTKGICEILVKGSNVSPSCGEIFKSGDCGFIYNERLFVSGRIDDMVKINGKKIFTKEIDEVIMLQEYVAQCVTVYVWFLNKTFLISFIVLKENEMNIANLKYEISLKIEQKLAKFVNPRLQIINNIPTLRNSMKPDKIALKEKAEQLLHKEFILFSKPFEENTKDLKHTSENDFDHYQIIHNIFAKNLNIDPKALKGSMDFYELGGDSLIAITCIADVNSKGFNCTSNIFLRNFGIQRDSSIKNIINKILQKTFILSREIIIQEVMEDFNVEYIKDQHKKEVLTFLVENFLPKELLGKALNLTEDSFIKIASEMFQESIKENVSFAIRDKNSQELVGLQLSGKCIKDESLIRNSQLNVNFENVLLQFLNYCKSNIDVDQKRSTLNVFIVALSSRLSKAKILKLLHFIEHQSISLAGLNGFDSLETVNTSDVTKTICYELGYKIMKTSSLFEFLQKYFPNFQCNPCVNDLFGYFMTKDI